MKITSETKWMVGLVGSKESKVHITKQNEEGLYKYVQSIMRDVFEVSFHVHDRYTAWNASGIAVAFYDLELEEAVEDRKCMLFELNESLALLIQPHDYFKEDAVRQDFPNLVIEDHTACINECQHKPSKRN